MGNGIAHVFAQSGIPVTMIDVSEDALRRGRETIEKNMDRQVKKNTLSADDRQGALGRIATSTDLGAVSNATVVVEAATENIDLKFRIFSDIDRMAPAGTILASNTSSISITQIAAQTKRPELVIGMHFMNPVPVMQLVEVIRGLATSDATTRRVTDLAKAVGKTPVEANDFAYREPIPADDQRSVHALMEGGHR
jgi:3-hydroxybutyryl-CoA dehydrogenase